MELKILNRICNILFLYRNIDIAGIKAVNDANAATREKFAVLHITSTPEKSIYFAIFVDNNTDCNIITNNK
jgi:hypothetical protein